MFIQAIGTESLAQGILPQILRVAEVLRLDAVLEGVETQQQLDYFVALGKPLVTQGWHFGKPGPADAIKNALLIPDHELGMESWNAPALAAAAKTR
jgi:sensor c-di-GMP phosphodiesterase-like protein